MVKITSRRDSKNRILRTGEGQRDNGLYYYQFTDNTGARKVIYSWRLVASDRMPAGKKETPALRDQIAEITKQLLNNEFSPKNQIETTVDILQAHKLHLENTGKMKPRTAEIYRGVISFWEKRPLAQKKIKDITTYDVELLAYQLANEGYKRTTISSRISAAKRAVAWYLQKNGLALVNPYAIKLDSDCGLESEKKTSLTAEEEKNIFEKMLAVHGEHSDIYLICKLLRNTGIRIGECCGLTLSDIDFENKTLHISRQIVATKNHFGVAPPKRKQYRDLPITDNVEEILREIIRYRPKQAPGWEKELDGIKGFLFLSKKGLPYRPGSFCSKVTYFNSHYCNEFLEDKSFGCHILRHTYASRLIYDEGVRPEVVQYLLGHSTLDMTLHVYAHSSKDAAFKEMLHLPANVVLLNDKSVNL